ncbi:hypothetical protein EDD66_11651 [Mobilisporobacter senegalensis]|uniref:Cof subfamily protein (Haloacid dehalogenase superfamily)/HAD superfamily hydrolase (TIGR01484 family) n=1 Tax=Mobilisporobacter senegalensis TaxID=1329262 RepID=A0A3N1X856_9FIRM|nr:Cof-type HAD-IIB family hydrolase [Mobilisporobacter senegalensis]ROR22168.1 hypothetical protein EDD66_11651 [Mobilisporobacter senegalensis]
MKNIIIFFDIDGTLIDCSKGITKPTDKTVYTLKEMRDSGAMLFITSGRPYCLINKEIRELDFDGYITSNGMCILMEGKVINSKIIGGYIIKKLISLSNEYNFGYHFETPTSLYTSSNNRKFINDYFIRYSLPLSIQNENFEEISKIVNKISVYLKKDEDIKIISKELNMLTFHKVEDCVYEACYDYISKGSAIKEVIEILDIKDWEMYAFGDGTNDIEMMQIVENSIAMGNCHPQLLKYAKYQTASVDKEGIYEFWKAHNHQEKLDSDVV